MKALFVCMHTHLYIHIYILIKNANYKFFFDNHQIYINTCTEHKCMYASAFNCIEL